MKKELAGSQFFESGAENGIRTRGPQLGKLMLYQLSYFRVGNANLTNFSFVDETELVYRKQDREQRRAPAFVYG